MNPDKSRGLEILLGSFDDLVGAARVQFGVSTGAVVLIVHAVLENHMRKALAALLTLAALCFFLSVFLCPRVLTSVVFIKSTIGGYLWREQEDKLDLPESETKQLMTAARTMEYLFNAGVGLSVLFLVLNLIFGHG